MIHNSNSNSSSEFNKTSNTEQDIYGSPIRGSFSASTWLSMNSQEDSDFTNSYSDTRFFN
jgi:hypothetical protein